MFALNDDKSFSEIPNWLDEFRKYIASPVPIALAGNKKDLVDQRKVTEGEAQKVATDLNFINYYETSALEGGSEINEIFRTLARQAIGK